MDMQKHKGIIYAGKRAYRKLIGKLPVTIIKHDYLLADQVVSFDTSLSEIVENANHGTFPIEDDT